MYGFWEGVYIKMFKNILGKNKKSVFSPVNGEVIPLEEVPDPVFSQKMMGEGVAIAPKGGSIAAPVDGKIIQVAPTKHAIGILANDGTEILIHVGLETVALKGEGFNVLVNVDDEVTIGQKLIEVDWDYIAKHVPSTITPIVITNSQSETEYKITEEKTSVQGETILISHK